MHKIENSFKVGEEDIFKDFCSVRDIRESTRDFYRYVLQKYSDYTKMELIDLIVEAEVEEDLGIRIRKRKINSYLIGFRLHLNNLELAKSSQDIMIRVVRSFYHENDIQLPKPKSRKSVNSRVIKEDTIEVIPKMDEITRFIEHCSSSYKAIVLMGMSSGMGRAEISSLQYSNLYDALSLKKNPESLSDLIEKIKNKENFIPVWKIKRVKTGRKYFTFSSPESVERIRIYLEELHYKHPNFEPNPDDKLFRGLNTNRNLKPRNIGVTFNNINKRNGFAKIGEKYKLTPHSLRRFFATTLEMNNVPHVATIRLMGHKLDSVTNAYFKTDIGNLKKHYIDVLDHLTTD